jgi:hypothetical protein
MAINETVSSTKEYVGNDSPDGMVIGRDAADKVSFHGAAVVAQRAHANQQAAPAGGTGAAAGGYDTAGNRDIMINLVNEMRTVLIEKGLMKGSA